MPGMSPQQQFQESQTRRRVHEPIIGPIRKAATALAPTGSVNFGPPQPSAVPPAYALGGAPMRPQTGGGSLGPITSSQPQTYSGRAYSLPSRQPIGQPAPAPESAFGTPGSYPQPNAPPIPSPPGMPQRLPAPYQGRQPAAPSVAPPGQIDVPQPLPPGPQLPIPNVQHPYEGAGLQQQSFFGEQGNLPTPNRSAMPQINQYRQDYRQSQLGGLYDAATELGNMNRYNASRPVSPFNPLATPISGPGMYGQAVNAGGLMNNAEAQQFQRNVGYMPSTTVGGAFGAPGSQPLVLDGRQVERTPATGAQIDSYLGQNPNGRFFSGATPGMVATARGMRPGFTDGQPLPDLSQKPKFDAGAYTTTKDGALTPSSATQLEKGREAAAVFDARRGGLEARRKAYEDKVAGSAAERKAGVKENAQQRFEARRARRGLFSNEEQIARANPEAYQIRKAEEAKSKAFADNAAADRGVREKLGMAEVKQRSESADKTLEGKYVEAGLTPPGKEKPGPKLTDKDYAQMHPQDARDRAEKENMTPDEFNQMRERQTGRPGNYWLYPETGRSTAAGVGEIVFGPPAGNTQISPFQPDNFQGGSNFQAPIRPINRQEENRILARQYGGQEPKLPQPQSPGFIGGPNFQAPRRPLEQEMSPRRRAVRRYSLGLLG